mmetsp:Transcript_17585/g.26171  ORF Transcript_17585/g.26171 Transcript_17585/m.26171 type:complete len:488 (+) Transcript_17585:207-1670(+)
MIHVEHVCEKIRSIVKIVKMWFFWVLWVPLGSMRKAFWGAPERHLFASLFVFLGCIFWKVMGQVEDVITVPLDKILKCKCDTCIKVAIFGKFEQFFGGFKTSLALCLVGNTIKCLKQFGWVLYCILEISGRSHKQIVKLTSTTSPSNGVFDHVRKVLHGALWHKLLFDFDMTLGERLSEFWHNHIVVGLGTECTRLKQRSVEKHTTRVHVKARLDVVKCIAHTIDGRPKSVVKHIFSRWGNLDTVHLDLHVWVHLACSFSSTCRFWLVHMATAEQKLTCKIRHFNGVHISANKLSLITRANTHKCKCFHVFTTQCTASHQKPALVHDLILERLSKQRNLVVVPVTGWLGIGRDFCLEKVERVDNHPLLDWCPLSRCLDDLLGNDTTQKCRVARDFSAGIHRYLFEHLLVNLVDSETTILFVLLVDFLGKCNKLGGIICIVELWQLTRAVVKKAPECVLGEQYACTSIAHEGTHGVRVSHRCTSSIGK